MANQSRGCTMNFDAELAALVTATRMKSRGRPDAIFTRHHLRMDGMEAGRYARREARVARSRLAEACHLLRIQRLPAIRPELREARRLEILRRLREHMKARQAFRTMLGHWRDRPGFMEGYFAEEK